MSCLSDVMSFFTNYVGPAAQPLNSQDVDRIFGNIVSPTSIISPRPDMSSPQEQLLPKTDSSSLDNEVKPGEDNELSGNDNPDLVLNTLSIYTRMHVPEHFYSTC